jgi:hypothetical protein
MTVLKSIQATCPAVPLDPNFAFSWATTIIVRKEVPMFDALYRRTLRLAGRFLLLTFLFTRAGYHPERTRRTRVKNRVCQLKLGMLWLY